MLSGLSKIIANSSCELVGERRIKQFAKGLDTVGGPPRQSAPGATNDPGSLFLGILFEVTQANCFTHRERKLSKGCVNHFSQAERVRWHNRNGFRASPFVPQSPAT